MSRISLLTLLFTLILGCQGSPSSAQPTPSQPPAAKKDGRVTVNPDGPVFYEREASNHAITLARGHAQGAHTLKILPRGGYKINTQFPTKWTLQDKTIYGPKQFQLDKASGSLTITDKPTTALQGTLRFSVCTDEACEIKTVEITTQPSAPDNNTTL